MNKIYIYYLELKIFLGVKILVQLKFAKNITY